MNDTLYPMVGFMSIARHAGVSRATAHRDFEKGLLKVDAWRPSDHAGQPLALFRQETADSYRQYRQKLSETVTANNRLIVVIGPDLQAALDEAYRKGYNAGRRSGQREVRTYKVEEASHDQPV